MFSRRTGWNLTPNRLTAALEAHRRSGRPLLDLTLSNPTRAGIDYPRDEIERALAAPPVHGYEPDPRGAREAREAIAHWYAARAALAARGAHSLDPDQIILTPGTSEAYGWLFKLLCDPGGRVLAPRPSYPLFEFLAALESVEIENYPLRYYDRWEIDREALAAMLEPGALRNAAPPRAIVVVHPNNPTGSFLSTDEAAWLAAIASEHGLPIVADEVFSTFPLDPAPGAGAAGTLAAPGEAPGFVLDGLSKSAGLPGLKLGWIIVGGPTAFREDALARLEMIADTYLPVASPIQRAVPRLLEIGSEIGARIRARTRANLDSLKATTGGVSACETLLAEGGWSAIVRVPRTLPEEELCLRLLEEDSVLVQPGWFFDFETEAYIVLSLLTPEAEFREGLMRLLARAG